MTRQARTDLRDRMQRVAAKPPTHPDTPKRARATSTRRPTAAAKRRSPLPDEPEPMPVGRTRLDTLVAWAQWELMSVPKERLHYLKQLLTGDGAGENPGEHLGDDD